MPLDQNFLMWTLIVGFFVPILIAFIQQEHWNSRLRAAVMFVVCIIVALGTCYFQGKLHLDDTASIITSILLIVVTAIASYKGLWQPSNVAPQIEHLTSGIHVNDFHEKMALRAA
jgi:hypothetical protein